MPIVHASWTDEIVATLRELHMDGKTFAEISEGIAVRHGVVFSRSSVIGKASRIGLPMRVEQPKRAAQPKRMRVKVERSLVLTSPRQTRTRLKIVRPAQAPAPPPPVEPEREGVLFADHREGQCRWPLWTLSTPFHLKRFCGEPISGSGPYCAWCHSKSITPKEIAA